MMNAANQRSCASYGALLGAILAFLLALGVCVPAMALADEPARTGDTTYTIRLYAGNRGAVNGQDMIEWSGLGYGTSLNLAQVPVAVTVSDGKYYAKGVRPAGYDNVKDVEYVALLNADGTWQSDPIINVTEDADYVVAYGVTADRVAYTVRYVDTAGNDLMTAQEFMGDIGDVVRIHAPYIENYVPQAYNVEFTLTGNPESNVFDVTYSRLAAGYTTTQDATGGYAGVRTPTGEVIGLGAAVDANGLAGAESGQPVTDANGEEVLTEDGTPLSEPIDTLTIDDDAAPLSAAGEQGAANSTGGAFGDWVSYVLVALGIALLIVAIVFWRRNKSKQDTGY